MNCPEDFPCRFSQGVCRYCGRDQPSRASRPAVRQTVREIEFGGVIDLADSTRREWPLCDHPDCSRRAHFSAKLEDGKLVGLCREHYCEVTDGIRMADD